MKIKDKVLKRDWELKDYKARFLGQYLNPLTAIWEGITPMEAKYMDTKEAVEREIRKLYGENPDYTNDWRIVEIRPTDRSPSPSKSHHLDLSPVLEQLTMLNLKLDDLLGMRSKELAKVQDREQVLKKIKPGHTFMSNAQVRELFPDISHVQLGRMLVALGFKNTVKNIANKTVRGYYVRLLPQPGTSYVSRELILETFDITETELKELSLPETREGYLIEL